MRIGLLETMCVGALMVTGGMAQSDFQGALHPVPIYEEPIRYDSADRTGPVAKLIERVKLGKTKLKYDEDWGWLPALMRELKVSPNSQMLVFSKTSLQRNSISPQNPRALYFNDDVYLGWIPGAPIMEISEVDPVNGAVFYDLDMTNRKRPEFRSNSQCLNCHQSARSMGVPGHVVRSVGTDLVGEPDLLDAASEVNHRTPLAERWAGWFVTGDTSKQPHRGNRIGPEELQTKTDDPRHRGNRTSLTEFVNVNGYIRNGSDVVALMVHDHQTHMHNFITRMNFETRIMMHRYGHIRYLRHQVDGFLRYLLFVDETPLTGEVKGNAGFVSWFEEQGPIDEKKRSLREFDLKRRLFKYPCSFLIHSPSFDSIPDVMRLHLLQRLHDILTGTDKSEPFMNISPRAKQDILEILVATKQGLPDYWHKSGSDVSATGAD
ncbi:MAG: hypothetical protein ACPGVU_06365 [Limisphaerales bacterium]